MGWWGRADAGEGVVKWRGGTMRQWQPILRSAAAFLSTLDARFARRILLAATCLSRTSFNEALWSGENNFVISQERARYRDREGADADTAAKTHQDPTIQQTDPDPDTDTDALWLCFFLFLFVGFGIRE